MGAISTPTDEWFVQDLRGPRVQLEEDSLAEFRQSSLPKSTKPFAIGAAIAGLALLLLIATSGSPKPEPAPPPVAAAAASPTADEYEADWEAAVEQRDPAFVVEKRELPLEPRSR